MTPADVVEATTSGSANGGPKLRFTLDLSFSTLVHIAQVLAVIGGIIWALVEFRVTNDRRERDAAARQEATERKLGEMEQVFRSTAGDMRGQLATLPDQKARLDQIERKQAEAEDKIDDQRDKFEQRLDAIVQQVAALRTELGHGRAAPANRR